MTSDLGCSLPTSHLTPTSQFTSMGHREPKAGWPSGAPPPHSGPILRKASLSPALALLTSGWALTTPLPSPQTQHLSAALECPLTLPAAQAEGRPQTSGPLLMGAPQAPALDPFSSLPSRCQHCTHDCSPVPCMAQQGTCHLLGQAFTVPGSRKASSLPTSPGLSLPRRSPCSPQSQGPALGTALQASRVLCTKSKLLGCQASCWDAHPTRACLGTSLLLCIPS